MDPHNSPNLESDRTQSAVIKVFGVGGGGCNALEQMIAAGIRDVEFKCINTDAQALSRFATEHRFELGNNLTKGLGAGANPEVGTAAATESTDEIAEAIGDADMLFLAAGMGGGTGTGALPLIAQTAREMGVLTVAVVTEPFVFEGDKRRQAAADGLEQLRECADSMIVVPNENLLNYLGPDITLVEAFAAANDVVANAVQSVAELITTNGLINVDFADVRTVMTSMGHAIMSTGRGMGEHRAEEAAIGAIKSPLLNNVDLKAAKGILVNISSSADLSMGEFQAIGDIIRQIAADDASVIIGTVFDEEMNHEIKVTVVATGLNPPKNNFKQKDNDELAAKLTQPTPTASEKAAAEAAIAAAEVAAAEANAAAVHQDNVTSIAPATELRNNRATHADESAKNIQSGKKSNATSSSASVQSGPPPIPASSNDASQNTDSKITNSQTANAQPLPTANSIQNSSSVSVDKVCMICGCVNGAHLEKCPWASGGPKVVPKTQKADTPKALEAPTHTSSGPLRSRKKLGLGIAAAGILALASAWFVLGNKNEDKTVVENPPVEEGPTNFIGDLRPVQPFVVPTLELDKKEIEAAEMAGDNLIPKSGKDRPILQKKEPTEVTELTDGI